MGILKEFLKQKYQLLMIRQFSLNRQNKSTIHQAYLITGHMQNNKMERFNGEFCDRGKIVRGVKSKDSVIFDGYQMFHNFLRPHMGLDGKHQPKCVGLTFKVKTNGEH